MIDRPVVLLVDDDAGDRACVTRAINERTSISITSANSLRSGADALSQRRFDLAIVDYHLGDGSGIDLVKRFDKIPMVVLTGAGDESVAVEAMRSGARDYVIKSPDLRHLDILPGIVEKVLAQERARKAEDLRAEDLRRSHRNLYHFSQTVASALMVPLDTLSTFAGSLRNHLPKDARPILLQYVEAIKRSARHARSFLADLMEYVSLSRSSEPVKVVDMRQLCLSVQQELANQITSHDASIEQGEIPPVVARPSQIRLLVVALLENAIRFGGEEPDVSIEGRIDGNDWVLEIKDRGNGIPVDDRDRVFSIFTRGANALDAEDRGNGIGLALAHRVVDLHDGVIEASDRSGGGTMMTVRLPHIEIRTRQPRHHAPPLNETGAEP